MLKHEVEKNWFRARENRRSLLQLLKRIQARSRTAVLYFCGHRRGQPFSVVNAIFEIRHFKAAAPPPHFSHWPVSCRLVAGTDSVKALTIADIAYMYSKTNRLSIFTTYQFNDILVNCKHDPTAQLNSSSASYSFWRSQ